jgi:hypothetical protein
MKGKGAHKGVMPKASMPVLSHAAKEQVVSAAKERKRGGKVVDYDKDEMKSGGRCDRKPRKKGGAVLSASASKAPMAEAATATTSRPGMK